MALLGCEFGSDMLRSMGIDPTGVLRFTINVDPQELLTVKLERLVSEHELSGLMGFLRGLFCKYTKTETHHPSDGGEFTNRGK